jgi:hypothetical protein
MLWAVFFVGACTAQHGSPPGPRDVHGTDGDGSPRASDAAADAADGRERDTGPEPGTDAGRDAGPPLDCTFTGTPQIEPADAEVAVTTQFTLEGVSALPPGCLAWRASPSAFAIYNSFSLEKVELDPDTGELRVYALPNDVVLQISAEVGGEVVATTTVRYFDPGRALDGVLHEVGVLRCPDYVELPREEIQEIMFHDFMVTFVAFETYVDYAGYATVLPDPGDPRRGTLSFVVDWGNVEPSTLDTEGSYVARQDGRIELRDLWLGPDAAQCGHVLERYK